MNYTHQHYQIGLTLLAGVGPVKAKELLNQIGEIELLFHSKPKELQQQTGFKSSFIKSMKRKEALLMADKVIEFHTRRGIKNFYFTDQQYPRRLKNCVDAPLILYAKSNFDLNKPKIVSIVGTRNATAYGKRLCKELIESFRDNNIIVVSGLAHGIDTYVHRYCLEFNVPTYGVLGHGFDRIYPAQNLHLAESMLAQGGLISEFIPGTIPDRENFPKRNRIVAGISDATIVIESKLRGGSLITANLANDYNRDVFAYPGSVTDETSQGCNALIANQKAHLIQRPEDFLTMMSWAEDEVKKGVQRKLFLDLSEKQKAIVNFISNATKIQIDVLSLETKLPISQLNTELFHLEMDGVILSLPGKNYMMA